MVDISHTMDLASSAIAGHPDIYSQPSQQLPQSFRFIKSLPHKRWASAGRSCRLSRVDTGASMVDEMLEYLAMEGTTPPQITTQVHRCVNTSCYLAVTSNMLEKFLNDKSKYFLLKLISEKN